MVTAVAVDTIVAAVAVEDDGNTSEQVWGQSIIVSPAHEQANYVN